MEPRESGQVFLGGTCGRSMWRQRIAIPALEAAGVTWFDPQLAHGEWTPAREEIEMQAKDTADVLLFVISAETRGVASIGEVAWLLGCQRALALAVRDFAEGDRIDGELLGASERDDLNRGRIFIRSMAKQAGVPVFCEVEDAVQHAIALVNSRQTVLNCARVQAILSQVGFRNGSFLVESIRGGFLIQLRCQETDAGGGSQVMCYGRKWHIDASADESDVVRTAFKAAITWQEHETREVFTYRGVPLFGPHVDVRDLAGVFKREDRQDG